MRAKKRGKQKIVILGARGLLGHVLFNKLASSPNFDCFGTVRGENAHDSKVLNNSGTVLPVCDLQDHKELADILMSIDPDIIINCLSLPNINSASIVAIRRLFVDIPHAVSEIAEKLSARVINVSSDAVFAGTKGFYFNEMSKTDAIEPYGVAKKDGEVCAPHVLNLRGSFVGYDPFNKRGLLEWFLTQEVCVSYPNYVFSGLATPKFAEIVRDFVLENKVLSGTYHIGSSPISKHDCLQHIARAVRHKVKIIRDKTVVVDRSLDTRKFASATGYHAQSWTEIRDCLCPK